MDLLQNGESSNSSSPTAHTQPNGTTHPTYPKLKAASSTGSPQTATSKLILPQWDSQYSSFPSS